MPGGKTKILKSKKKVATKETSIQQLETLVRKDDAHISSELHYFKGLSIMITVLIVVVFFTFGCLFASLYWEVKMMSVATQQYIEEMHQYLLNQSTFKEPVDVINIIDPARPEDGNGLSFE